MQRFKALDIFRGMTICLMIIVNTPGSWSFVYPPLLHADWHGFTITDLVFPSFLFAVGTAIAFVTKRYSEKGISLPWKKIISRTVIIFLLGYIMYWFPFVKWSESGELVGKSFNETRIWGVLQRIAICYFLGMVMISFLSKRNLIYVSIAVLLAYWGILWWFGDYSLEGNFARLLDLSLFGESHLYKGEGMAFDPEGLLSTLPATINVIGGYLAGRFIIDKGASAIEKVAKLLIYGTLLATLSYFWHFLFPINKKIWTSSYVLLTIGLNAMMIGILIYLIDIKEKPFEFKFFEIFGKNSLFIYLLSGYLATILWFVRIGDTALYTYIYQSLFKWMGTHFGSFVFALTFMMLCWAVGWWLDKKKIYIRV